MSFVLGFATGLVKTWDFHGPTLQRERCTWKMEVKSDARFGLIYSFEQLSFNANYIQAYIQTSYVEYCSYSRTIPLGFTRCQFYKQGHDIVLIHFRLSTSCIHHLGSVSAWPGHGDKVSTTSVSIRGNECILQFKC